MFMFVRFMLGFMLVATSIFLILLVLIQRGRGGGLAGALGGMGGQSAFGTKAGDLFTKITIGVATFWILLCILSINVLGTQRSLFSNELGGSAPEAMEGLGTTEAVPATGGAALPAEPGNAANSESADNKEAAETSENETGTTGAAIEPTPSAEPTASTSDAGNTTDTTTQDGPSTDVSEETKPAE